MGALGHALLDGADFFVGIDAENDAENDHGEDDSKDAEGVGDGVGHGGKMGGCCAIFGGGEGLLGGSE